MARKTTTVHESSIDFVHQGESLRREGLARFLSGRIVAQTRHKGKKII
jgi:hypothetical protein